MQDLKGKTIIHQEKEFLVSSVLVLKTKTNLLGFYLKDGKVPHGSHVAQIEIPLDQKIQIKESK